MNIKPTISIEEENGLIFNVVKVDLIGYDLHEAREFVTPGLCKVIITIDKVIHKTFYFKDGVETSKEKIIQDERIKQLRK
jgi:hypothetical protein